MVLFTNKHYSEEELLGLLESILFISGKAIDTKKICLWFNISKDVLEEYIKKLNTQYQEHASGFFIISVASGYQLVTNPIYKDELKELFGCKDENKLSQVSMEILAIIAYKQPISKEDIDKIRGVNSTRSLNTLLGYKLIDIVGSDNILGSILYGTSKRFLEIFKLNSLKDLPVPETLASNDFF